MQLQAALCTPPEVCFTNVLTWTATEADPLKRFDDAPPTVQAGVTVDGVVNTSVQTRRTSLP